MCVCVCVCMLSHVLLFAILWTVACQAPLSVEFSRQEYWSVLPWLLQRIFSIQASNPGLPHYGQILNHLSYVESPQSYIRTVFSFCSCWVTSVVSNSLWPHGLQPTRLLCPWNSPGKNSGVGCQFLLQVIFPTQGSILGLPHCRQNSLPTEPSGTLLIGITYIWLTVLLDILFIF